MRNRIRRISLKNLWKRIGVHLGKTKDVYFISGMCYSCSVFDNIVFPKGYNKVYIEWEIPMLGESLVEYAHRMASKINTNRKFILVGYSFGGVVMQEIARFMSPEKVIVISSMKDKKEIPNIFLMARKVNFADNIPMRLYRTSNFMINLFNRYVYSLPTTALEEFMTVRDPIYIRWALRQITHWTPLNDTKNLYHIHGTRDQVFPYEQILDAITIKGGDHLMVVKRAKDVSEVMETILKKQSKNLK